jgi:LacI family transcriptional regulator
MRDVAKHAQVSIKTVSNVVNNWPYVTEETRLKVQKAIEVVGYRPNRSARSLVTGKSKTIGVVVTDVANPFYGSAIRGCEDFLYQKGYSIFLCNTSEEEERERYYLNQLLSHGVDGLILWGTRIGCRELEALIGPSHPLVTVELGEEPVSSNHTCINVDDCGGAEAVTAHLIAEGHRRIAHIGGPPDRVTSRRRRQGYMKALETAGIPVENGWMVTEQPTVAGGFRSARDLLRENRPDALFCFNDLMAFGAMIAARNEGLRVPQDVAIAGFDDIQASSLIDPPLTTVRIGQYALGRLTAEIILERLQGKQNAGTTVQFPVELVIRGSSSARHLAEERRRETLEELAKSLGSEQHGTPMSAASHPSCLE